MRVDARNGIAYIPAKTPNKSAKISLRSKL